MTTITLDGYTYQRHPTHGHWTLTSHTGTWLPSPILTTALTHIEHLQKRVERLENTLALKGLNQ